MAWTEDHLTGMPRRLEDRPPAWSGRSGLLRYVLGWASGAALVVAAILVVLGRDGSDEVTLPPVRQIELTAAARSAGCDLRTGARWDMLGLPVPGAPGGTPAKAGVYDEPADPAGLVTALRRGVVVIQHRADLPKDVRDQLRRLRDAIPAGTIVTPEAVRTPYAVAVVAWRRVLGCRDFRSGTADAIRLFRGRYIGSGPDPPGPG